MNKSIFFRISRNFSSIIVAQLLYKVLTFVMMMLLARFLDVEEFGQLAFGLSFVWIFLFLSDFGFTELLVRDVTLDNKLVKKYIGNMTGMKIVLSCLAYMILLVSGKLISGSDILRFRIIAILGLSIVLDSFVYYFRSIYRIKNNLHYESVLLVVEAIIKFSVIILVIISRLDIQRTIMVCLGLLVVSFLNFLLNLAIFVNYNKPLQFRFERKLWFHILKNGLPFAIVYIFNLMNLKVDVIMLSKMRGNTEAGLFSADLRIIEQVLLLPLVLSYVALPEFLRLTKSIKQLYRFALRLISVAVFISLVIIYFCYSYSSDLIRVIYGQKFINAGAYLNILSLILPFFFIKVIIEKVLYSYGKQLYVGAVYFICVLLNIVLGIIVIPHWGIPGISLVSIVSEMFMVIGLMFYFRKRTLVLFQKSLYTTPATGLEYYND